MADDNDHREQVLRNLIYVHGRTVRTVLSRSERSRDDVDELWADVFLVAFRRLDELAVLSVGAQRGWLIRTATHLLANHGRRQVSWRRMLGRLAHEPLEPQLTPEEMAQSNEDNREAATTSQAIEDALGRLRAADRQVLVLDALGFDGPGIGRHLGISPGAARKRLMVARIAFRQEFGASKSPLPDLSSDQVQPRPTP